MIEIAAIRATVLMCSRRSTADDRGDRSDGVDGRTFVHSPIDNRFIPPG
jgi:hypothetical protein